MAGKFYIGFERDDGLPGLTKEKPILTTDIDRVALAYASIYFPDGVEVPAEVEGEAPTRRAPTGSEVFDAMGEGLWAGILANVVRFEEEQRRKAAAEAATPIGVVP
jgi:hypothetical protein